MPAEALAQRLPAGSTGPRVGGLTPLTTVDYPGELAAVVFFQGCPFRCSYCHNGHLIPVRGADLIPWGQVLEFLEARRGLLDAVVFSGGEPTLQPALEPAMSDARRLGYKIGLHTAGPYPVSLRRVLHLLDWVGLDIKALAEDYQKVTGVPGSGERAWESLELLLRSGVGLQVRTTPMPGLDSPTYLERLAARLAEAGVREHLIQTCRTEHLADPRIPGLRSQETHPS
ncbi:MAG: anaerobic ribonucleoside-triphosphate reductase activating protein [Chromatiaceae bacterium]